MWSLIVCLCFSMLFHFGEPSSATANELCSFVRQMSGVCFPTGEEITVNDTDCTCVGEKGPRGHRGSPGKDATVDYDLVDSKIDERLQPLQQRLERLEEMLEWFRASNGLRYKVFERKVDYTVAKRLCNRYKAGLASTGVRDPTVRAELMNLVKFTTGGTAWIGLDDRQTEGEFVWEDGATLKDGEIEWSTGQPDDSAKAEDCVNFKKEFNWKANDDPCSLKAGFICEKKID